MKTATGKIKQLKSIVSFLLFLLLIIVLSEGCRDTQDKAIQEPARSTAPSAEEIKPLSAGAKVPELTLQTADNKSFDLNESIRNKPTVLIFYRGGWCPYCSKHLAKLQESEPEIIKAGYQIIAISPDKPGKIRESIDKNKTNYLLLSDSKMEASKAFGIAFKLDESTIAKYKQYGIDLVDASGQSHYSLPVPSVFVVGTDEVIKFDYVNPDYKVRLETSKLLTVLKTHR